MTVDLIFLATMVGNIEHTVYLHTSRGNFPYQVHTKMFDINSRQLEYTHFFYKNVDIEIG